jgi:hypothetical protein
MKKEKLTDFDIDELLQQSLKDDLPPEVEKSMKTQLIQLRKKMELQEQKPTPGLIKYLNKLFRVERQPWIHWMLKKGVLAAASLAMIVLGSMLHMSGSQNVLAKKISLLGTSVLVSGQVSRVESMECAVKALKDDDKSLTYSIQWVSPNLTKVQIKSSDDAVIVIKTLWLSEEEILIKDHIEGTINREKNIAQISDPHFHAVLGLLSPPDLVERMYGQWQLKQYEKHGDCEWGIFTITLPEESTLLEISVDLCTYFPVNMEKFILDPSKENKKGKLLLNIHFKWNTAISLQEISPEIARKS